MSGSLESVLPGGVGIMSSEVDYSTAGSTKGKPLKLSFGYYQEDSGGTI